MTADIINLNKVRKARERAEAEKQANANRVRFGRKKAEKEAAASEERAKDRLLDDAKLPVRGVTVEDELEPGSTS